MSLLAKLVPLGIKLLEQYREHGNVEKSTVKAAVDVVLVSLKNGETEDLGCIGRDLISLGNCLLEMEANHKPSDGHIPPIKPGGESGLTVEKH